MRKDLMDILACPMCKGDLDIQIKKENKREIVEGRLICKKCKIEYPIEDGIPNLLPPDER